MEEKESKGFVFERAPGAVYRYKYWVIAEQLNDAALKGNTREFLRLIKKYCLLDLFFLIHFVLGIEIFNNKHQVGWIYDAQDDNDRTLDLWTREFGKTTIISIALNIQDILKDPEITIGIISEYKALAKKILVAIKSYLETNELLKASFPDILYKNPKRDALKWSEDDGIIVKRMYISKDPTVGAHGLLDGMPTGAHYKVLNYDDIVTANSVNTLEQIKKTKEQFAKSTLCGNRYGKKRIVGTPYEDGDLITLLEHSGEWKVRKHSPLDEKGANVLWTPKELSTKIKELNVASSYAADSQIWLKPIRSEERKFKLEWIKRYTNYPAKMNVYIVCDPSGGESSKSDYTSMWVVGIDHLKNRYILDGVRDRLSIGARYKALCALITKWDPIRNVGYEKYGMQSDIQYMREKMLEEGFQFPLVQLGAGVGSELPKGKARIETLQPLFQDGKIWIPSYLPYTDQSGKVVDLCQVFTQEEYLRYPTCLVDGHDDMLDCMSLINDARLGLIAPITIRPNTMPKRPESIWDQIGKKSSGKGCLGNL